MGPRYGGLILGLAAVVAALIVGAVFTSGIIDAALHNRRSCRRAGLIGRHRWLWSAGVMGERAERLAVSVKR